MKKIIFLRPAPYSDRIPDKDIIAGFDLIGSQVVDPLLYVKDENVSKTIDNLLKKFKPVKIYSSPAMRCVQTAELFNLSFKTSLLLNEIKFSLTGTLSKKLLKKDNIDINRLRKELVNAFIRNKIGENPSSVIARLENLFEILKNTNGNVVCISHGFIMKFFEIFFRNSGKIKNPNLFLNDYNWELKPYEFLDGFCVSISNTGKIKNVELLKEIIHTYK